MRQDEANRSRFRQDADETHNSSPSPCDFFCDMSFNTHHRRAPATDTPYTQYAMEPGRNRDVMPGRLTHLLRSKIAVAIFGAVLIAGAGSAAALAASGNLQAPFASQTPSSHNSDGHQNDDQNDDGQHDGHEAEGTISSIDSGNSSFVIKTEHGASVTVIVNSATVFTDGLNSFGDLKTGMSVEVAGNPQSDGTLTATKVHGNNEGADDDSNDDHGGNTGSATPGSDDHSGATGSSTPGSGGHDDGTPHD